jgi:hypothetical protein
MMYPTRFALAALCGFAAFSSAAQAGEAEFLKRFHGSFSGSGTVRLEQAEAPRSISCRVSGTTTASSLNISGTCSAGMMSKAISASLRASGNGSYSGTFNGISGTSSLSGRRSGNSIVLAMRGAEPATMTVSNSGSGISLSVVANKTQMTSVRLARAGGNGPQLASIAE